MSAFWSAWIILLIVVNLGITLFLFLWGTRVPIPTEPDGTTGHVWAHGVLREGVRRLPRWWYVMSGSMFAIGIGYLALFPGFGSFKGLLGWTSQGEHAQAAEQNATKQAETVRTLRTSSIEDLAANPAVLRTGAVLYADNCAACHGRDARGNARLGVPNLTDADTLHGGDAKAILASIEGGRRGAMPAMGAALGDAAIVDVTHYVKSLSGAIHDETRAALGKRHFAACAACHGADGRGNPALGAPNLADNTWLYGGDYARIEETIRNGRNGFMPPWRDRLSEDQVRAVAAYVYAQSHRNVAAR
jgi:cytochrome c oxidase cbb3-type subunit 3